MPNTYSRKLKQPRSHEHAFAQYVRILGKGKTGSRSLSHEEAYTAMTMILAGDVHDVQLGAFLMLLRVKEESPEELTGFVEAAREHIDAPTQLAVDLDWSSYAGKKRQLPWFLLSCFLLADQGIRIFMHGSQGHTPGRLYTENVLSQLSVPLAKSWTDVELQLERSNFSFMPLDFLCPELQAIIDLRDKLGLRSPVHTLVRLINPLAAPHTMQSIFHPSYGERHQRAAQLLGQINAAVFKGEGGEVERKPEASCIVKKVVEGELREESWEKFIDGRQVRPESLAPMELIQVWRGESENEYGQLAIIGTAAIALKLLNRADTQSEALALAKTYWKQRNRERLYSS